MRYAGAFSFLTLGLFCVSTSAFATGGDTWSTLSHDGYRTARSLGQGALSGAMEVAWKRPMGGALTDTQLQLFDVDGDGDKEAILVSAGKVAARRADDTQVWASSNIGATRVIGVHDLDGTGPAEVVVTGTSPVGLYILDGATGATLWFQPTNSASIQAIAVPDGAGHRLFLTEQLGMMIGYQFGSGIGSPASNKVWQSGTSPWSTDMAAGDVNGDGQLDVVRGHDRGFVVYDAKTGAVMCDASNIVTGTVAPMYFPAFSTVDVHGDGRAEVVLYDYSYYYSEDAGVFVVSCAGNGQPLSVQVLWKQQWITDVTPGSGNDVNAKQVRYLADAVAQVDGAGSLEMVYSLWDESMSKWTTFVRDAATGTVLASRDGEVIEAVEDVDDDGKTEVLMREATGIGSLPKPFFSKLRGYDFENGVLIDKGWIIPDARAATFGGFRNARVTTGAGAVNVRQNVDGSNDPAVEPYIFQKANNGNVTDPRPGRLLAVHGKTGVTLRKYDFPAQVSGGVLAVGSGTAMPTSVAESFVMLTDGGLRLLDDGFVEQSTLRPGNFSGLVTVASLDGVKNTILGAESSEALVALDATVIDKGFPVEQWRKQDMTISSSRGYVNAPGLVVPLSGAAGAFVVARGHTTASYEEQALVAMGADGAELWKADLGANRQVAGFDNFELLDDLDGDGTRDFFLNELEGDSAQALVVRKGSNGQTMAIRPTADLFPPNGVYMQGHAAVDINGDGKLDVVSALHGSWYIGMDVSKAATGDPVTAFAQIFRVASGANGQAMVGDVDGDSSLDLMRSNSQNAITAYERRSLLGVVEASYTGPHPNVAGSDANTAAFVNRPDASGKSDFVWAGMSGDALGAVARLDGQTMTEVWFVYLADGAVHSKASKPATRAALYSPVVADLDGDGTDEILVGSDDGRLYALNVEDASLFGVVDLKAPVQHTIVADIDKDDRIEVLCSLADGTLVAIDAPGAYQADEPPPLPDGGVGGGGFGGTAGTGGMGGGFGGAAGEAGMGSSSSGGGMGSSSSGMGGSSSGISSGVPGQEGGCGCRAVGNEEQRVSSLALLLGMAAAALRRRRS